MTYLTFLIFIINSVSINASGPGGLDMTFKADIADRRDLSFHGAQWLNNFGEPNLPCFACAIGIPQDGSVEVIVLENLEEVLRNVEIKPVVPVFINEAMGMQDIGMQDEVYKRNEFFPENLVNVTSPSYFRDINTVSLRINAARYNPVTKELKFSKSIKLRIKFKGIPRTVQVTDESFEKIYQKIIINYDQCKSWRRESRQNARNPFSSGVWFKIEISDCGLYRIGYDEIKAAGLDPKQFDPKTLKIFTAGFDRLLENVYSSYPDSLVEIPCFVEGESDHSFDRDDFLVFYGYGASHYKPDSEPSWIENGYAVNNVYWLTFGSEQGKRMEMVNGAWNGQSPVSTVNDIIHLEDDLGNPTRSGINWYWRDISPGTGDTSRMEMMVNHPNAAGTARTKLAIFTLTAPGPFHYKYMFDSTVFFDTTRAYGIRDVLPPLFLNGSGELTGDSSLFKIELARPTSTIPSFTIFMNSLDVIYARTTNTETPFHSLTSIPVDYSISCANAGSKLFVLDVTNMKNPKMLDNMTVTGDSTYLSSRSDSFQLLYFSRVSSAKKVKLIPANPGKLRNPDLGCEYLFITHKNFYSTIMPLVNYRRRQYTTKVVTVDAIFDDFSFGKYDPLAIKHFLFFTKNNWTTMPKFVFLIGDATYDYKNNLGKDNPPNYIPMYEANSILSGNPGMPYNTIYEGEYVKFGNYEEMVLGRITVRNSQEVRDFTDKLIAYENSDIDGIWNKRIILAADDEYAQVTQPWEGLQHSNAIEYIANRINDSLYDIAKIHTLSYHPFPPHSTGTTKEAATADFIRELNKGGLAGCFYGHGNTHQLAHEKLLYYTDVPLVRNSRRNWFFYFASCTVGRFDDSDYECLAEEFVRKKDGAIGTMGATGPTGPENNNPIGYMLFDFITDPDTNLTMGECFLIAKSANGQWNYVLLGDPATEFRKVKSHTNLGVQPDSLQPLGRLKVNIPAKPYYLVAFVRDTTHSDTLPTNRINGHVRRAVRWFTNPGDTVIFDYYIDGKEFFQGYGDNDTAQFTVPIVSTVNLPVIKLSSYKNQTSGFYDSIRVFGNPLITPDTAGPEVALYDGARKLKDGDWVDAEFILTGVISDESGVNLLNTKDDARGFYLHINQDLIVNRVDLRDGFIYDKNSCTTGEFKTTVNLDKEIDTITVNVSDNKLKQTTKTVILNVELFNRISIDNVLVYPNPVRDRKGLWFTFNLTGSGVVDIKIFTIAGRLVKVMDKTPCPAGYNQIFWDGLDNAGDAISNGVYLVQIFVEASGSSDKAVDKFIIAR